MSVYMAHPNLPGQGIRVRKSAVKVHQLSGWRVAEEPPPKPPAESTQDSPGEPADQPRRRRASRTNGGD